MEEDKNKTKGDLSAKGLSVRATEAERQAEARRERAAKTLRENLLRRKQQGRARRAGAADETSGLPAASPVDPENPDIPQGTAANSRESGE